MLHVEVIKIEGRIDSECCIRAVLFGRRLRGDLCCNVLHVDSEQPQQLQSSRLKKMVGCVLVSVLSVRAR